MEATKDLPGSETLAKELIIRLILQDLRHYQLTATLAKVGLNQDLHDLELMETIAELMGVPRDDKRSDQWGELYFSYLERSPEYEVEELGKALQPLAEECYYVLEGCMRALKMNCSPRCETPEG